MINWYQLTLLCLIKLSNSEHYIDKMYRMVDKLVRKTRWKAFHFYLDDNELFKNKQNGIFPLRRNPKGDSHLERFENGLYDLIKSLEFRKIKHSQ